MKISAIIKATLLTAFIGFCTMPQVTYANNFGSDNGQGNGGHDNGHNGNGNDNNQGDDDGGDGAGGNSVPISGLGILLVAGVGYTAIKAYNFKKGKVSLI